MLSKRRQQWHTSSSVLISETILQTNGKSSVINDNIKIEIEFDSGTALLLNRPLWQTTNDHQINYLSISLYLFVPLFAYLIVCTTVCVFICPNVWSYVTKLLWANKKWYYQAFARVSLLLIVEVIAFVQTLIQLYTWTRVWIMQRDGWNQQIHDTAGAKKAGFWILVFV